MLKALFLTHLSLTTRTCNEYRLQEYFRNENVWETTFNPVARHADINLTITQDPSLDRLRKWFNTLCRQLVATSQKYHQDWYPFFPLTFEMLAVSRFYMVKDGQAFVIGMDFGGIERLALCESFRGYIYFTSRLAQFTASLFNDKLFAVPSLPSSLLREKLKQLCGYPASYAYVFSQGDAYYGQNSILRTQTGRDTMLLSEEIQKLFPRRTIRIETSIERHVHPPLTLMELLCYIVQPRGKVETRASFLHCNANSAILELERWLLTSASGVKNGH